LRRPHAPGTVNGHCHLPKRLIEGYESFLGGRFTREQDRFRHLAAAGASDHVDRMLRFAGFLAEVKVARQLGADVIGASIVLEVIIARTLGLRVAALAVVTPFGAGFRAATQTLRKPLQAPSA
jgi:cytosine/adenosine deaminase-related metal-dependent hydrolase